MATKSTTKTIIRRKRSYGWNYVNKSFDATTYYTALNLTDSRVGGENPNWKQDIKAHRQAGTGLNAQKTTYRGGYGIHAGGFTTNLVGGPTASWQNTVGYLCNLSPGSPPAASVSLDNAVLSKYLKRAKAKQTAFRGLTALGELRETLSMIRNPARAIRRGLDDYVKSVMKRTRRVKKRQTLDRIVGDTWLEYTWGWGPAISDVRSAGVALNQRLERYQGSYAKISASGKEEFYSESGWSAVLQEGATLRRQYRYADVKSVTVRLKGEVRSVAPNPMMADLDLFGASWREIVPTAWELVPWSSLVDYFTNIGDVLDAWSFRRSDITFTVRTERRKCDRITIAWAHYHSMSGYSYVAGSPWSSMTVSPLRIRSTQVLRSTPVPGLPTLEWTIPGLGRQWANMASVANGRRKFRLLHFG